MMIVKNLFLAALCVGLVTAATLYSGYSIREEASQLNEDWEKVTLRQWVKGDVQNKRLFELSDFYAAEEGMCFDTSGFTYFYIPLYAKGHAEDAGENVRVVAQLRHTGADEKLWKVLDQPLLKVQDRGVSPPANAKQLSGIYPKINWDKVQMVSVDDQLPTLAEGNYCLIAGGLGALVCLLLVTAATKLWYREYSAKKNGFADPLQQLEMGSTGSSEVGQSSSNSLFDSITPYLVYLFYGMIAFNAVFAFGYKFGLLDDNTVFGVLIISGPIALGLAVFLLGGYFLIAPKLTIQRRESHEIPAKVLDKLNAHVEDFQLFGFEFVGYAFTKYRGEKYNAYLLSSDQKRLVEITCESGKATYAILGVADHGLVFMASDAGGDEDILIDGTSTGVPLVADVVSQRGAAESIACFDEFHDQLKVSGGRLLHIEPQSIFHAMHYEAIAYGWYAYHTSSRFSKPESLPTIEEVTRDGYRFNFRRSDQLDNAYQRPAASEHTASTVTSTGDLSRS